jgi:hypothetical protein
LTNVDLLRLRTDVPVKFTLLSAPLRCLVSTFASTNAMADVFKSYSVIGSLFARFAFSQVQRACAFRKDVSGSHYVGLGLVSHVQSGCGAGGKFNRVDDERCAAGERDGCWLVRP